MTTDDADEPPDYRALATPGFVVAVVASIIVAGVLVIRFAPVEAWPAWFGLVTVGVLLGWIDAATTWLPLGPTRLLWALTAVGCLVLPALSSGGWERLLTAAIGAAAFGAFFALAWWLSRGQLGFGDVRLAPVLGAAAGSVSAWTIITAALLGTLLGALWAISRLIRRRRDPFPYGPALVLGTLLAPAVAPWI
ncbi:hypothetical protein ACQBAU_06070 [Propionibacteriaceae bacterium Y2011]|uniref:hypothetical protein n=1 Tax=Microlunatus sp. Y2014 TaxID=3418488 RepID=UPI003B4EFF0F